MSFHESCDDIKIFEEDRQTMLTAMVRNRKGDKRLVKISLDKHIGNSDGWFIWGGSNFTQSASNVQLESTPQGPKLTADLVAANGGSKGRQGIMLADKIMNDDGHLKFLGP